MGDALEPIDWNDRLHLAAVPLTHHLGELSVEDAQETLDHIEALRKELSECKAEKAKTMYVTVDLTGCVHSCEDEERIIEIAEGTAESVTELVTRADERCDAAVEDYNNIKSQLAANYKVLDEFKAERDKAEAQLTTIRNKTIDECSAHLSNEADNRCAWALQKLKVADK